MVQNTVEKESDRYREQAENLVRSLQALPDLAGEAVVDKNFVIDAFFDALGFSSQERIPAFKTGKGKNAVDYALRHNTEEDIFLHSQINPHVLVKLKGRDINLINDCFTNFL